jgi:hypothetical protein
LAKKLLPPIFAVPKRELSSAGLEHLPYKQGVTGSIPVAPTIKSRKCGFFYALYPIIAANILVFTVRLLLIPYLLLTFTIFMQKLFLIITLCAYCFSLTGYNSIQHFCMKKNVGGSISFGANTSTKKKCNKCGMQHKKKSCCNDEVSFNKVNTEHQAQSIDYDFSSIAWIDIVPNYYSCETFIPQQTLKGFTHAPHGPPLALQNKKYILHCSYLI